MNTPRCSIIQSHTSPRCASPTLINARICKQLEPARQGGRIVQVHIFQHKQVPQTGATIVGAIANRDRSPCGSNARNCPQTRTSSGNSTNPCNSSLNTCITTTCTQTSWNACLWTIHFDGT